MFDQQRQWNKFKQHDKQPKQDHQNESEADIVRIGNIEITGDLNGAKHGITIKDFYWICFYSVTRIDHIRIEKNESHKKAILKRMAFIQK